MFFHVRSAGVIAGNRANMLARKGGLANFDLVDLLLKSPVHQHRDGQPLQTRWCLDPVTVLPRAFFELHVVENDKRVHLIDQVEITTPGKIRGLQDRDFHRPPSCSTKRSATFSNPKELHRALAFPFPSTVSSWILRGPSERSSAMACPAHLCAIPFLRYSGATYRS